MEQLLCKLRNYSRYLEMEDSVPYWESQIPELEDRIAEMQWNLKQKELELLQLKEPNFIQRVFGRAEQKKENLNRQIREIRSAHMAATWDLEGLQKKIEAGKREMEILAGSGEAYEEAKARTILTTGEESLLLMEQITAFAPLALETAWHVLETLEEARSWMQRDAQTTRAIPGSRRMELLYRAQDQSRLLLKILAALPEGITSPGSRLEHLYDYIGGVTSEFKQLDRLETVQEQIRTVRNQLKLLLGA